MPTLKYSIRPPLSLRSPLVSHLHALLYACEEVRMIDCGGDQATQEIFVDGGFLLDIWRLRTFICALVWTKVCCGRRVAEIGIGKLLGSCQQRLEPSRATVGSACYCAWLLAYLFYEDVAVWATCSCQHSRRVLYRAMLCMSGELCFDSIRTGGDNAYIFIALVCSSSASSASLLCQRQGDVI